MFIVQPAQKVSPAPEERNVAEANSRRRDFAPMELLSWMISVSINIWLLWS
jgi:hypothetical protein